VTLKDHGHDPDEIEEDDDVDGQVTAVGGSF
jgi:hypothetical protein